MKTETVSYKAWDVSYSPYWINKMSITIKKERVQEVVDCIGWTTTKECSSQAIESLINGTMPEPIEITMWFQKYKKYSFPSGDLFCY